MIEMIGLQNEEIKNRAASPASCEVSHFIKNFHEAVMGKNSIEIATYFSDEMESFYFPLDAIWTAENIVVGDHLATFNCTLKLETNVNLRMTCVLDKSEGYWQIIHGELHNDAFIQ